MILELNSVNLDGASEAVRQIHDHLEDAKRHIEGGGIVTVTKAGEEIGTAGTTEELVRLVIL
ncbi:hypothetical protein OVA24_08090 [Luteolibacter sp. SL250]|uniref:hypothetical protein n=1 Tax=Luteolibacter sp. SL250 TaxID=2995170 RepID=UPI00226D6CC7|nr:hypothetical protein [Luteolibacter sp. SL250]WAC21344.1 hypothetical protein OVA24_08090 [Luteolibacter sp. SL250]